MGTVLILTFIIIIAAYAIAIYLQYRKGRTDVKMYFHRDEKEKLAQEIDAVEIPEISHWETKSNQSSQSE